MTTAKPANWKERLDRFRPDKQAVLMEVCGTHTMTARRSGIHSILPEGVKLLSGPGCPVCVTPIDYVDHAVELSQTPGVIVTSYGDLLRVPGTRSSLEKSRAQGGAVRVVYSTIDALSIARENPDSIVVFLGVGFETTAPTTAAAVLEAFEEKLDNFTVLSAHRLIPPALEVLLAQPNDDPASDFRIDGFIAPGHVTTILGVEPYGFVAEKHKRPVVVAGFSADDMLLGIERILEQLQKGEARVENAYARVVRDEGNPVARALLEKVFEPRNSVWRGLGEIPASGAKLREQFQTHDAELRIEVKLEPSIEPKGCQCGTILRGEAQPEDCSLFGKVCTPQSPVGACMVSSEGSCSAAYRYGSAQ